MDERADLTGPWVADLGYDRVSGAFVVEGEATVDVHPFAPELRSIFAPEHGPAGAAVLCIDRVPTVCMLDQRRLSAEPLVRRDQIDRKSTRLNSSHLAVSRMPSSA